jgi:sulfide:quinone oxidoreductase
VGDVTSVGTPKAGVFSEGQAAVVAGRIAALIEGDPASDQYNGRGLCYLDFGRDQIARVEVTFVQGQPPTGEFDGPSTAFAAEKLEFGTDRIQRWFGRTWP